MLEFKNVNAFYGKKQALFDINAHIKNGTVTAVLGLNGSGKTTLFSLILNQIKYNGEILFKGKNIKEFSTMDRAKSIAFLPQNLTANELTVYDLVALGRSPYLSFNKGFNNDDKKQIEKAIKKTQLNNFTTAKINSLSGGERQRAYLAMILAQDTELLIFDEPLSYLDPSFSALFLDIINEEKQKGKTIIIIMHDVNKALDIADNALFLNKGRLEFFGGAEELIKTQIIEKNFGLTRYSVKDKNQESYIYK